MSFVDPQLRREIFGWHSDRLGMDMPIVRYGHWGHGLLLFPTSAGDFLEAERMYLIKSIEPLIFAGKVQVWCIDSINKHSWVNDHLSVPQKAHNQARYSGYVEDEVMPHIRRCMQNDSARIGVAGASFGAFFAANAFFRRPDLFDTLIGMSGFYDLREQFLNGYSDDNVYFNNPPSFIPNMDDNALRLVRDHSQIHLICGQGQWERVDGTRNFSKLLWDKGIWNNLDLWGHDAAHDWPWWRQQLPYYIRERLGW
jgi:esterase/lipase superfamily enzyme